MGIIEAAAMKRKFHDKIENCYRVGFFWAGRRFVTISAPAKYVTEMMMSGWGPYFLVIGFRFDTAALAEKKLVETRFRIHHEQIALPRAIRAALQHRGRSSTVIY